jgi:peptidyl-prolyl cis-trans isomerase A (cyclophilin A)
MLEKEAPKTVQNFVDLSTGKKEWTDPATGQKTKRPLYPGTIFHRVIPGFMIQGGDPKGNGTGQTDLIGEEYHPSLRFDRPGRVGMGHRGPGTSSCQFFIMDGSDRDDLTGRYTIFAQVVRGQEVVNKIANLPRNERDRPNNPPKIVSIVFQRIGKKV